MAPDSLGGVRDRLLERPIRPIHIETTTADVKALTVPGLLVGWSFRETTGSATAAVELFGSQSTGTPIAGEQTLASGGSGSQTVSNEGVLCEGGILVHVVSGSVRGTLWVRY